MLHDGRRIALRFVVVDRWVQARAEHHNDPVCRDACVEFFVRPRDERGYFNIESSCLGVLHASYIEDWTRTSAGFARFRLLDAAACRAIERASSLRAPLPPERDEETAWQLGLRVDVAVFEASMGTLGELSGQRWRGNFYKCADASVQPHWASWAPLRAKNFHDPECFGELVWA